MSDTETPPELVTNARFAKKRSAKSKTSGVSKPTRRPRPLKNLDALVLQQRYEDLKKRVQMAECKIVLMNQKLVLHNEEIRNREIETCESNLSV
jgi:hypothetical protein